MKALSIRQPWAWLILHAGKTIENREWPTRYRGPLLIHASKGMTKAEYREAFDMADRLGVGYITAYREVPRGAIVGRVDLVDCVETSDSPWFQGRYGFVLANPQACTPYPWRGELGLFEVPEAAVQALEFAFTDPILGLLEARPQV